MNTVEAEKITKEAMGWIKARVAQHYVELTADDMAIIENELNYVLSNHVSDANIMRRQYNPATDQVEES